MAKKYGDALDTDNDTDLDLRFIHDEEPVRSLHPVTVFTRVRVQAPFQVVYATIVYRPGDVAEVPAELAADWVRDGWVTPAE